MRRNFPRRLNLQQALKRQKAKLLRSLKLSNRPVLL